MNKDIMELSVNNLEERKLEFLKEHSRKILFEIIDLIDAEKFDVIQVKKVAEADDDCGDVIHFINFAYNDDNLDIFQIVEMMRDLRKGINERKRKLTNGN